MDRLRVAIERLVTTGLLSSEEDDGHTTYDVTPRGQEFLDTYWRMRGYLDGLDVGWSLQRGRRQVVAGTASQEEASCAAQRETGSAVPRKRRVDRKGPTRRSPLTDSRCVLEPFRLQVGGDHLRPATYVAVDHDRAVSGDLA